MNFSYFMVACLFATFCIMTTAQLISPLPQFTSASQRNQRSFISQHNNTQRTKEEPIFFHLFPFSDIDQQIYFHGHIPASAQTSLDQGDFLEFTLPIELQNYFADQLTIQFLDNDNNFAFTQILHYSFTPTERDIFAEIPLVYDLLPNTKFVTFVGFFSLRPKDRQNSDSSFIPLSDKLLLPHSLCFNSSNCVNSSTTAQITILCTFYPSEGDSIYTLSHLQETTGASKYPFYPDQTPYKRHISHQSATKPHLELTERKDTIHDPNQKNAALEQPLIELANRKDTINDSNQRNATSEQPTIDSPLDLNASPPCTEPLSTSFECNRFQLVRTTVSQSQYHYSIRAYVSHLKVSIVGFQLTLFGSLTAVISDTAWCTINGLKMVITKQEFVPTTNFFTLDAILHDGYQRPDGDTIPAKHIRYLSNGTPVDISCWVSTDVMVKGDDILNGVSFTFTPDPIVEPPTSTAYTITYITRHLTKLDTNFNHFIQPWRAFYNSFFSDLNVDSQTDSTDLLISSITPSLGITNNFNQNMQIQGGSRFLQHLSCEWFLNSQFQYNPETFDHTIQLSIFNIQNQAQFDQALITLLGPNDHTNIQQNHHLVLFSSELKVDTFRRPSRDQPASNILFKPINLKLDPDVVKKITPHNTKLVFSLLMSLQGNDIQPTAGTPGCALQYIQLYPDYYGDDFSSRLPMIYYQTNKPSWRLFSQPNQFVIPASEISERPSKYAFNSFIFNMTIPRPIKWVFYNIVSSDYRFEGNFTNPCYINDEILIPLGPDKQPIVYSWITTVGFDFSYQPNTYYNIRCPDLYLIQSNKDESDYHPYEINSISTILDNITTMFTNIFTSKRNLAMKEIINSSPLMASDVPVRQDTVQISIFGLETDQYFQSYDDYYFAVTTISFSFFSIDSTTFYNFLLTVGIIVGLLVGSFLGFWCCMVEPRYQRTSGNRQVGPTNSTNILGEDIDIGGDDYDDDDDDDNDQPASIQNTTTGNNNNINNPGLYNNNNDDVDENDLYLFSQQQAFQPPPNYNLNSNPFKEPLLQ